MSYASFEPLPEDVQRREEAAKTTMREKRGAINRIVSQHGFRELTSDYLGMSSFYYGDDCIWEVNWGTNGHTLSKPLLTVFEHIRELNGLPALSYDIQPTTLVTA